MHAGKNTDFANDCTKVQVGTFQLCDSQDNNQLIDAPIVTMCIARNVRSPSELQCHLVTGLIYGDSV